MYFFFAPNLYSSKKRISYISFTIIFCGTVAKDWLMSVYFSHIYVYILDHHPHLHFNNHFHENVPSAETDRPVYCTVHKPAGHPPSLYGMRGNLKKVILFEIRATLNEP